MNRIVLGTRGSELARAQTSLVEAALRAAHPRVEIAIEVIKTVGDERSNESLPQGRKGLFTSAIEECLLGKKIDVAIHSAKDLPSESTAGLEICAAWPRAAVEDVLIAKKAGGLESVTGAIATGSVRRQYQLRYLRPGLTVVELRGNVPTRLRKLASNSWEAIVLARAGLIRLGFDQDEIEFEGNRWFVTALPNEQFVPAGGQGIIALQIRTSDDATRQTLAPINHLPTLLCLRAEREFLRLLHGDCGTPVGVLARIEGGFMKLRAQIFSPPTAQPKTGKVSSARGLQEPETLAAALFEQMYGERK